MFLTCTWNGASFYFEVFARRYETQLMSKFAAHSTPTTGGGNGGGDNGNGGGGSGGGHGSSSSSSGDCHVTNVRLPTCP